MLIDTFVPSFGVLTNMTMFLISMTFILFWHVLNYTMTPYFYYYLPFNTIYLFLSVFLRKMVLHTFQFISILQLNIANKSK